jgi:hypothetical protein
LLHDQMPQRRNIPPDVVSLGLGRRVVNKWNPCLPANKRMALPLLWFALRGERVPKQTSAEAINGLLVST